ncbi:hypothetical protein Glove_144g131 [Diversispora epigaea]|uniref:Uncharacterized protein n=1 Tax=Diversispora epigaea TaxID=1348612 RepID=A0A397J398_9GLOM|nr:hypothetical protein Glove_144g131 [Diversispora epigaea]
MLIKHPRFPFCSPFLYNRESHESPISEVLIKERSKGKEVVDGRDKRIEESRRKASEEADELIRFFQEASYDTMTFKIPPISAVRILKRKVREVEGGEGRLPRFLPMHNNKGNNDEFEKEKIRKLQNVGENPSGGLEMANSFVDSISTKIINCNFKIVEALQLCEVAKDLTGELGFRRLYEPRHWWKLGMGRNVYTSLDIGGTLAREEVGRRGNKRGIKFVSP